MQKYRFFVRGILSGGHPAGVFKITPLSLWPIQLKYLRIGCLLGRSRHESRCLRKLLLPLNKFQPKSPVVVGPNDTRPPPRMRVAALMP